MKQGFVYIMTNRRDGTLYIGVTSDLAKRDYEHKSGEYKGFTKRYNLNKLVYYAVFGDISEAIIYEKKLKKFLRFQKIELIEQMNPQWDDLTAAIRA